MRVQRLSNSAFSAQACLHDTHFVAGGQGCNQFEPRPSTRETTPLGHPKKAVVSDEVALPMRNVAEWRRCNAELRRQKVDEQRKKRQLSVENLLQARESARPVQDVSEQVKAEVAAEASQIRRGPAATSDQDQDSLSGHRSSPTMTNRPRRRRRPRSALQVRWKPKSPSQSGGAWSLQNLRAVQAVRLV